MPAAESNHALRVLSSLNQQRAVGRFCDAVLNVGGGVVYLAHRNILACFSELFQQSNMPAASCMEFCLQECPNDGLELLLNFVYTGELKLEPENLEKVQHAAASLCVPEALTLCQQFKETSVDPVPFKRKRGRPRKSPSDTTPYCSVKEENLLTITKDESSCDTATANCSMAATTTTTTRSGRVVKGPRRLVTVQGPTTDFTAPEKVSKKALLIPMEMESGDDVEGNPNPDQSTEIDINDNSVSQGLEAVVEEEEEDDVGDFEGIAEDTDEEYVPVEEPISSAPSTSTARKCKVQSKTDQNENGEAVEEDSKKDSVQCPVCEKSFKSKYYLKVHNRYTTWVCSLQTTVERIATNVSPSAGGTQGRGPLVASSVERGTSGRRIFSPRKCFKPYFLCLRLHVVSHTGDMPHKCSTCPEQFMHKKNLTIHMMKVHGHPKPHAVRFLKCISMRLLLTGDSLFLFCFSEMSALLSVTYVAMHSHRRTT
uniref:Zinc finger and BTB domain containing 48 n=1 Tax=Cyclopterus lumpus TaxID=8103 RepID=A0A8C2WW95_CYCLU